jgi:hypothetical protein
MVIGQFSGFYKNLYFGFDKQAELSFDDNREEKKKKGKGIPSFPPTFLTPLVPG